MTQDSAAGPRDAAPVDAAPADEPQDAPPAETPAQQPPAAAIVDVSGDRGGVRGWLVLVFALFALALGAGVTLLAVTLLGGSGGDDPMAGALSDRVLRLGEEATTEIEVRSREPPAGLVEALNPGMTDGTPEDDLIRLRVHPEGVLVGSFRIVHPDGTIDFWLVYDVPGADGDVEADLLRQLDESPWQVIAGQSSDVQAGIRFQSTLSGDIEGTAIIRPIVGAEGGPLTSVVYIIEVTPLEQATAPKFELPAPRPVPEDFPAHFLVLEGMTPINVIWGSSPAGVSYQLVMLTRESAFDVATAYRNRLEEEGWELVEDRAVGFATVLEFQSEDGNVTASLTADAFSEDDRYTAIVIELSRSR